jgi:hypothetical protein
MKYIGIGTKRTKILIKKKGLGKLRIKVALIRGQIKDKK